MADFDPRVLLFLDNKSAEDVLLHQVLFSSDVCKTFNQGEHQKYDRISTTFEKLSNQECKSRFRFEKDDILKLMRHLGIPEVMYSKNGTKWTALEGLCVLLRRLNYPKRYEDMVPEFGRHPTDIGLIFNSMVKFVTDRWGHLLSTFDQPWLQLAQLHEMAQAVLDKGCPMANCFGFVDGKIVPNARPIYHQRELYNGKDKVHGLKYQSLTVPNGLISNLYGPVEGRRHDSTLLRESGLLQILDPLIGPDGMPMVIYGDKAYPISKNLITPYRGIGLNADERLFNRQMNASRISVEWDFGKVNANFAFLNYRKNLKVFLQPVALYYKVAVLLSNFHTCLYGNQVSQYFNLPPPSLEEYLV